jgi:hypothetical protein
MFDGTVDQRLYKALHSLDVGKGQAALDFSFMNKGDAFVITKNKKRRYRIDVPESRWEVKTNCFV